MSRYFSRSELGSRGDLRNLRYLFDEQVPYEDDRRRNELFRWSWV
jgi:hypothetical protein